MARIRVERKNKGLPWWAGLLAALALHAQEVTIVNW
jgi:hypothetical protein